jgi:hypothetical protein
MQVRGQHADAPRIFASSDQRFGAHSGAATELMAANETRIWQRNLDGIIALRKEHFEDQPK